MRRLLSSLTKGIKKPDKFIPVELIGPPETVDHLDDWLFGLRMALVMG
jgi:hypothetical protein